MLRKLGFIVASVGTALSGAAQAEDITVLFQKDGMPFVVASVKERSGELCMLQMQDPASGTQFTVGMNGSERVIVATYDPRPGSAIPKAKMDAQLPLAVEAGGVRQAYNVKVVRSSYAEAVVTRAAQAHLRSAIQSKDGLLMAVGGAEPIRFMVPREPRAEFERCVTSSLRDRLVRRVEDLRSLGKP